MPLSLCNTCISRSSGLMKPILQGTVLGKRRKGRQKKRLEKILRSGQGWTLLAQLGQLKTGLRGKRLLLSHPWCPNVVLQGYRLD